MIRIENLLIEGSSLEPTLLERLRISLGKLGEMSQAEAEKRYGWWNDLNSDFIRLNQNYQDYMRELNSVKAEEMMKTKEFLVFKDRLIEYLRSFVKSLQTNVTAIEQQLRSVDREVVNQILQKVTEYELSIPRMDTEIDEQMIYDKMKGRCQVIVNPYMIKVEKMPAVPENWMGILEFKEPIEYVFFCLVLMFLEDKEAEEQFVLSELTEYVQSQYQEEQIDWTVYRYRRHMIKVMKYCVSIGILNVDDGSEEGFAKDDTSEVLYENTGASRYFMKNFTQDIMGYTSAKEFEKEEWIDVNEDRGIVRRQRVYRKLLMSMGMYKDAESEEDFAYLRNYRNMIQGDLAELFDCELHVHSSSAFLVLGEECRLGRCFPEGNTLSDVVLLTNQLIQKSVTEGRITVPLDEQICIPKEVFRSIVEECKEKFGQGLNKTYREMTFAEFYREVEGYMEELMLIEIGTDHVKIRPAAGKIYGKYPEDFLKNGGRDE